MNRMNRMAIVGSSLLAAVGIFLSGMTPHAFAYKQDDTIIVIDGCTPGKILTDHGCMDPPPPGGGGGHFPSLPDGGNDGGPGSGPGGNPGGGFEPVPTGGIDENPLLQECLEDIGVLEQECLSGVNDYALWACEEYTFGISRMLCLIDARQFMTDYCVDIANHEYNQCMEDFEYDP